MLNKKSASATSNSSYSNFLSNAVTIKGTYKSDQDAIIAGTIEGDVHVKRLNILPILFNIELNN